MNTIEKRIQELYNYAPNTAAPSDLEDFWRESLAQVGFEPEKASVIEVNTPFTGMKVQQVIYTGSDDTPLHAWYIRPAGMEGHKLPCVVFFHGYTGGKGYPEQYASWLMLGVAVMAVDVRGQGGETGSHMNVGYGTVKGWLTQGILEPKCFYYHAITLDALAAIHWAANQPDIDTGSIAVCGVSQGGGLALITSALSEHVQVCVANIPNMCHIDFGILHSNSSLAEAAEFVHRFPQHYEQVLRTLSYFDLLHLAERIRIPTMISVGLKDTVCMPETIFPVYNRISSAKQLEIYPFTGHAVEAYQQRKSAEYIMEHLKLSF